MLHGFEMTHKIQVIKVREEDIPGVVKLYRPKSFRTKAFIEINWHKMIEESRKDFDDISFVIKDKTKKIIGILATETLIITKIIKNNSGEKIEFSRSIKEEYPKTIKDFIESLDLDKNTIQKVKVWNVEIWIPNLAKKMRYLDDLVDSFVEYCEEYTDINEIGEIKYLNQMTNEKDCEYETICKNIIF